MTGCKKYIRRYMIAVVALLLGLVIAYIMVDQMIVDTIEVKYHDQTLEIHALDASLDHPFSQAIHQLSPIPDIELGDYLLLDFKSLDVVSFQVKDYVLDEEGQIMYGDLDGQGIEINGVEGAYYLTVYKNMAAGLSSSIHDKVRRGIEIVIAEPDKTSSYLLVIETDLN